MPTLNQLASQISEAAGKSGDIVLQRRIKDLFLDYRADRIKQSIDKDGVNPLYVQKYILELSDVDSADSCLVSIGCIVKRSANKIPTPIRYKSSAPFLLVGSTDGKKIITYSNIAEIELAQYVPQITNIPRYTYTNGYIYIYNYLGNNLRVDAPYENPQLIIPNEIGDNCLDTSTGICYDDDMEFPIPLDMLNSIRMQIYKELGIYKDIDTNEVEIDSTIK